MVRLVNEALSYQYADAEEYSLGTSGELHIYGPDVSAVIAPGQWVAAEKRPTVTVAPAGNGHPVTVGDH